MKQTVFCLAVAMAIASCNNQTETTAAVADKPAPATETAPYPIVAAYSKDFEIGDPELGRKILELWVHFDNNELDKGVGYFADSVRIEFPDGSILNGPKDSVMAATKAYRNTYSTVHSTVEAWTVLKPKENDRPGSWVCIWGKEVDTGKDGKVDSIYLQENWHFNTAGKIDLMLQFARKIPK